MAWNHRGRRRGYDHIAVGSIAGVEHIHNLSTDNTLEVSATSPITLNAAERTNLYGGGSNIANAAVPGVEDTVNDSAGKLTTAGETVAD